ncbi:hypothetical protein GOV04_04995 [Candidatus Woesearchaeota archaeon]|nr:hypothetical protein [Candidatus Woesearchaeota archaeon]
MQKRGRKIRLGKPRSQLTEKERAIIRCLMFKYKTRMQVRKELGFNANNEIRQLFKNDYLNTRKEKGVIEDLREFKLIPALVKKFHHSISHF